MFLIRPQTNPRGEIGRLQRDVSRMLRGAFASEPQFWQTLVSNGNVVWPKLDISETDEAVHVSAELPGLKEGEIDIEVLADALHISGEKKDGRVVEKHNFHSVERTFGRFDRTISLPAEVDSQHAEATFKDGVLMICLPKLTPVAAQKIPVNPAS